MSSHHVIRENQEPALLIQDYEALDLESLGQLLEWSPTLVTNENSLDFLLAEGIKVDVLFAAPGTLMTQEHTKLLPLAGDFIAEGIAYLISHKHTAVNILSNYIPTNLYSLAKGINIVLFYLNRRFVFVHSSFEKWKPKAERIYVEARYLKSFQGLTYVSEGVFETIADGFIQLDFNTADYVLIGEDL